MRTTIKNWFLERLNVLTLEEFQVVLLSFVMAFILTITLITNILGPNPKDDTVPFILLAGIVLSTFMGLATLIQSERQRPQIERKKEADALRERVNSERSRVHELLLAKKLEELQALKGDLSPEAVERAINLERELRRIID